MEIILIILVQQVEARFHSILGSQFLTPNWGKIIKNKIANLDKSPIFQR